MEIMKGHCLMLVGAGTDAVTISGWRVRVVDAALRCVGEPADVALLSVTPSAPAPARLRAIADAPFLPVLALAPDGWAERHDWRSLGYDGTIVCGAPDDTIAQALADWDRAATLMTLDRLEASFGAEMVSLVERFAAMLASVRDERDPAVLASMAHRVAGIAGTLGFAALGQLWLRFSEGEAGLADSARRAASYAMETIARRG
jgi:hypothetical protein